MRGIISCIRHGAGQERTYFVISEDGSAVSELPGTIVAECGDLVEYADGRIESVIGKADLAAVHSIIAERAEGLAISSFYKTGMGEVDAISERMWQRLCDASQLLMRKLSMSAPIIIRFHNDADGSGGACSLYVSIKELCARMPSCANIVWLMQRGVTYNRYDASNDMLIANNYDSLEKPLLMIVDFGTSVDSNEGIQGIGDKFDIIWLDHHPIVDGFNGKELQHYVNPWQFDGDSNFTAGLLASVFCKTFSKAVTREYEHASLVGDYSKYADPDIGNELSSLLDLITSDLVLVYGNGKTNVTPQEILATLSDKEKVAELLSLANIKLEEAVIKGLHSLKSYSAGTGTICLLDFEHARSDDSKYPLPGRFSSKLLTRLNESGMRNVILVVSAGSYLLMRIDRELCSKLDLREIVREMSARHPDLVEGGGGHRCAGAIKVREKGMSRDVSNDLVNVIKGMLSS